MQLQWHNNLWNWPSKRKAHNFTWNKTSVPKAENNQTRLILQIPEQFSVDRLNLDWIWWGVVVVFGV